jgi:hypothetical protein
MQPFIAEGPLTNILQDALLALLFEMAQQHTILLAARTACILTFCSLMPGCRLSISELTETTHVDNGCDRRGDAAGAASAGTAVAHPDSRHRASGSHSGYRRPYDGFLSPSAPAHRVRHQQVHAAHLFLLYRAALMCTSVPSHAVHTRNIRTHSDSNAIRMVNAGSCVTACAQRCTASRRIPNCRVCALAHRALLLCTSNTHCKLAPVAQFLCKKLLHNLHASCCSHKSERLTPAAMHPTTNVLRHNEPACLHRF